MPTTRTTPPSMPICSHSSGADKAEEGGPAADDRRRRPAVSSFGLPADRFASRMWCVGHTARGTPSLESVERHGGFGPGCTETKYDLVVMPSRRRILRIFTLPRDHKPQNSRYGSAAQSFGARSSATSRPTVAATTTSLRKRPRRGRRLTSLRPSPRSTTRYPTPAPTLADLEDQTVAQLVAQSPGVDQPDLLKFIASS